MSKFLNYLSPIISLSLLFILLGEFLVRIIPDKNIYTDKKDYMERHCDEIILLVR